MIMMAIYSFSQFEKTISSFDDLLDDEVSNELLIRELTVDFKTQVQEWKNILIRGDDPAKLDKYWARFEKLESHIQKKTQELTLK